MKVTDQIATFFLMLFGRLVLVPFWAVRLFIKRSYYQLRYGPKEKWPADAFAKLYMSNVDSESFGRTIEASVVPVQLAKFGGFSLEESRFIVCAKAAVQMRVEYTDLAAYYTRVVSAENIRRETLKVMEELDDWRPRAVAFRKTPEEMAHLERWLNGEIGLMDLNKPLSEV